MSDKKISELTSATTVAVADYLILDQGGTTLKVDVGTFLNKLPPVTTSHETVASGTLNPSKLVSKITVNTTTFTLAAPTSSTVDNVKTIVCSTFTAATGVVTVTGGIGFTTLTFSAHGQSATLKNIDGNWYVIGTKGVAVA